NLLLGHWLRMLLSGGMAMAAAALAESAASAAIVTLSFTLGTWALDFIGTGRGGWMATLATYTPTAALRFFEQGLLRLNTGMVMLTLAVAGFALAAVWLQSGQRISFRLRWVLVVLLVTAGVVWLCSFAPVSVDV